jgi:hypothetical protein
VSVRITRGSREEAEAGEDLFYTEFWFDGDAQDDPREWFKEALIAAIEDM